MGIYLNPGNEQFAVSVKLKDYNISTSQLTSGIYPVWPDLVNPPLSSSGWL